VAGRENGAAGQRVGASGKKGAREAVVGVDSGTGMPLRGNSRVRIGGRPLGPTEARKHCPPPDEKAVYTSCTFSRVKLIITMRFEGTKNLVAEWGESPIAECVDSDCLSWELE
jgi:hypothetical protein